MSAVLAIARADFAERSRRFTFLVTIAAALYAGYLWVPDPHAGYGAVIMNGHRGLYTASFLGYATSMLVAVFLSLAGFFLVRGSVERDRDLQVDGIVCASRVSRATFLAGKFLSNLATLLAIAAIAYVAAIFMQYLRGEDPHFDAIAYVVPFVTVTIPGMAIVAALAVVFDIVPFLRGVLGGVVYFIAIWNPLLILPITASKNLMNRVFFDPFGMAMTAKSMHDAAILQFPHDKGNDVEIGGEAFSHALRPFVYHGFHWTAGDLAGRALWLLAGIVLVAAIAPLFDRFRRDASGAKRSRFFVDVARLVPNLPGLRLLRAEIALLVNGTSIWWIAGAVVLAIVTGVAPLAQVKQIFLPVALIWPLERLSALGSREKQWDVVDVLGATPGYAWRTVLVQWIAGTCVGVLICGGFVIRLFATGDVAGALACVALVAATASAALALGTATGARRVFESAYVCLWYIGPINGLPQLNFVAAILASPAFLASLCAVIAVVSVAAAAGLRVAARSR